MTVEVLCPHCGAAYQIAPEKMGKSARCKKCSQSFALESRAAETGHSQAALETGRQGDSSTNTQPVRKLGRFEIRAKLGSGAFGTVYRAFDPLLEREVALKVPNPAALETEADKARYLREPKAAAQLRHPNIVPIFDAGVDNGQYYIASVFIDGKTLQSRLEEQRPDLREAAQLVMKLASALQYAHEQGIVHRDVKPANIMLDAKGEPHLMDFGLAQIRAAEDRLTHDGTVLGTPAYMSPEQARGQASEVGPASDQYSLGVVLYELLCGERPFSGPPALVISLLQSQEPESPRKHNRTIPRDLETICLKAMAKEPNRRYPTCDALQDDLRSWLAGAPVRARPLSVTERATRWCRRNPLAATLAACSLAGLIGIACVSSLSMIVYASISSRERLANAAAQTHAIEADKQATLASQVAAQLEEELANLAKANKRIKIESENALKSQRQAEVEATNAKQAQEQSRDDAQKAIAAEGKATAAANDLREVLYDAHMMLAQQAWNDGNITLLKHILLQQHPDATKHTDLRGFEWYHFNHLCNRERFSSASTLGQVQDLAFSPDGSLLACACEKGMIVCNTADGRKIWSQADSAFYWGTPRQVRFIGAGKHLVWSHNDGAKISDARSGADFRILKKPKDKTFGGLDISRNGITIAYSAGDLNDDTILTWNVDSGTLEKSIPIPDHIHCLTFNGNSESLIYGTDDGVIAEVNIATSKVLNSWKAHFGTVTSLAMQDCGLVSASFDRTSRDWGYVPSLIKGDKKTALHTQHHFDPLSDVTYSPNRELIGFAGGTISRGEALIADVLKNSTSITVVRPHLSEAHSLAFNPTNESVAVGHGRDGITLFDISADCLFREFGECSCLAFSRDGNRLVCGSRNFLERKTDTLLLWDVPKRKEIRLQAPENNKIIDVAFSSDGTKFVSCAIDGTLTAWDSNSGRRSARSTRMTAMPTQCAFTNNGSQLLIGSRDGSLSTWNLSSAAQIASMPTRSHGNEICNIATSRDGKVFATSSLDGCMQVWGYGGEPTVLSVGVTKVTKTVAMALNETGDLAATAGTDNVVTVRQLPSGRPLRAFHGCEGEIRRIAFHPSGRFVACASNDAHNSRGDGEIRVWHIFTGQQTFRMKAPPYCDDLAFSSDGQSLAAAFGTFGILLLNGKE